MPRLASIKISWYKAKNVHFSLTSRSSQLISNLQWIAVLLQATMLISEWISPKDVPTLAKHQSYEGQVIKGAKRLFYGILQPKSCNPQFFRVTLECRKRCQVVASIKISWYKAKNVHFSQPSRSSWRISNLQWIAVPLKPTMLISERISPKDVPTLANHQSFEGQVIKVAKRPFYGILQPKNVTHNFSGWL